MVVNTRNTTHDIHTYKIAISTDFGAIPKQIVKKTTFHFQWCLLCSFNVIKSADKHVIKICVLTSLLKYINLILSVEVYNIIFCTTVQLYAYCI